MEVIEREDDVLVYYDSYEQARQARDELYPEIDPAYLRQFWIAGGGHPDDAPTKTDRPGPQRSKKRPGKWFVSYRR